MSNPDCYIFVGPTLYRQGMPIQIPPGIVILPPLRRGDVERLVAAHPPGTMILVDGVFHQELAVGHREIRDAITAGWHVWGLSSMGAIRAREMTTFGVRGYGEVFDLFQSERFEDFQDDEVTLIHEADPPYRGSTEPTVHLRAALAHLIASGCLSVQGGDRVIERLKALWYGERTLHRFAAELRAEDVSEAAIAELLTEFDRFRIKTGDLCRFLESNVWQT